MGEQFFLSNRRGPEAVNEFSKMAAEYGSRA
jgi:hypothetical protein